MLYIILCSILISSCISDYNFMETYLRRKIFIQVACSIFRLQSGNVFVQGLLHTT